MMLEVLQGYGLKSTKESISTVLPLQKRFELNGLFVLVSLLVLVLFVLFVVCLLVCLSLSLFVYSFNLLIFIYWLVGGLLIYLFVACLLLSSLLILCFRTSCSNQTKQQSNQPIHPLLERPLRVSSWP